MDWMQITISTTSECADIVAMYLFDEGSEGVSIKDSKDIIELQKSGSWDYIDESLVENSSQAVYVTGFFAPDYDVKKIYLCLQELKQNASSNAGSLEVTTSIIKSQDWENAWKQYYRPIEIKNITIVPKWLSYSGSNIPVYIDPGMAFGTGNHETTSMCISLMQDFALSEKNVLDVGCGSGILGISAIKLGCKSCTFIDNDNLAIKATEENASYNQVLDKAVIYCGDLLTVINKSDKKADIVLANLTAGILKSLFMQLDDYIDCGSILIISGIINEFADDIKKLYSTKFTLQSSQKCGEWQAFAFKKL